MDNIYQQLLACGYTPHTGDNGWWLGPEHELWLLTEQYRLYGPLIRPNPVTEAALAILGRHLRRAA